MTAFLGIIGGILIAGSFLPYIKDIIKGKTKPHIYTWFIWSVTHTIAAVAIFEGDGGLFATISVASGGFISFIVLLLSFKHGTKNITLFDSITFAAAIVAIGIWWQLDHPDWAIIIITGVDILGFLPTFRKTWLEPRSESLLAWTMYAIGNGAAFLALTSHTISTSLYIIAMIIASAALIGTILYRKKQF